MVSYSTEAFIDYQAVRAIHSFWRVSRQDESKYLGDTVEKVPWDLRAVNGCGVGGQEVSESRLEGDALPIREKNR